MWTLVCNWCILNLRNSDIHSWIVFSWIVSFEIIVKVSRNYKQQFASLITLKITEFHFFSRHFWIQHISENIGFLQYYQITCSKEFVLISDDLSKNILHFCSWNGVPSTILVFYINLTLCDCIVWLAGTLSMGFCSLFGNKNDSNDGIANFVINPYINKW